MAKLREDYEIGEFSFADEERFWLLEQLPRCPICQWIPALYRKTKPKGRFWVFSIRCKNLDCKGLYNTPYVESSDKARTAWKLSIILAKP